MSSEWFREKFEISRKDLHDRYTPAFHVNLPLTDLFHALCWEDSYSGKFQSHWVKINRSLEEFYQYLERHSFKGIDGSILIEAYSQFSSLGAIAKELIDTIPTLLELSVYGEKSRKTLDAILEIDNRLVQLDEEVSSEKEDKQKVRHALRLTDELLAAVSAFRKFLQSKYLHAAAVRAVLLKGEAGVGKSHHFCEAADRLTAKGSPAILLLGQYFGLGNPWDHILSRLDLRGNSVENFLGALDSAAQAVGKRALILIDGINDGTASQEWRSNLAGLLHQVKQFPRIAVIFSCRSSYEKRLVPPSIGEENLVRIEHRGFLGHEHSAVAVYFYQRGIDRPNSPMLAPEFSNPLFLKTCSDALIRRGEKALPKGISGLSSIFEFYTESLQPVILQRLSLDTKAPIIKRALLKIAGEMAKQGRGWINKEEAQHCLEMVLPGKHIDLLDALIKEGALIDNVVYQNGDEADIGLDIITFTYQRFSDHFITKQILQDNLDTFHPENSFQDGTSLSRFFSGDIWDKGGIIEMMYIQVPESVDGN